LLSSLILAAGGSTRLGQPKQLLRYRGQSLLRRVVELALALPLPDIVVVLGHLPGQMTPELAGLPVKTAHTPDWRRGMGSSIATGMAQLDAEAEAVLILLVDQPKLTPALAERIIHAYQAGNELVVSDYGDTIGVPALFGRRFFDQLRGLATQGGAKEILRTYGDQALRIPFPGGAFDVDTPEDYRRLMAEDDDG
jgi:molybdenum cofactor cytidylyltransferase